jgi:hypothetical protein
VKLRSYTGCVVGSTEIGRGDEIDRIAGAIKATHPDFSYQLIAEPQEVGDGIRPTFMVRKPQFRRAHSTCTEAGGGNNSS